TAPGRPEHNNPPGSPCTFRAVSGTLLERTVSPLCSAPMESAMSQRLSFYGSTPEDPRDDLLSSYLTVLERRNGSLDIERPFPTREAWMEESEGWTVRSRRRVDPQAFMEGFTGGQTDRGDLALQALLTFVRINAGEAYGVEVVSRLRKPRGHEMVSRVERVLQHE